MAIKLFDGFDTYKTISEVYNAPGSKFSGSGSHGMNKTGGRFGGSYISLYSGGDFITNYAANQGSVVFFGLSFRGIDYYPGDRTLVTFMSSASNVLGRVYVNLAGQIAIANASSTVVARSAMGVFPVFGWFRLEIKFIPGTTSSNGEITVRVNGKEVVSATGINTRNSTSTLAGIYVSGISSSSSNAYVDDIVVWDDQGSHHSTWLGDLRIDTLVATANGTDQDWTPNSGDAWAAVDDSPSNADDDTTYISSNTIGQKSNFTIEPVASVSSAIMAVQVRARSKKSDAGSTTMKTYLVSGETEVVDANAVNPSTAYLPVRGDLLETNPDTDTVWDDASVAALEVGVELAS